MGLMIYLDEYAGSGQEFMLNLRRTGIGGRYYTFLAYPTINIFACILKSKRERLCIGLCWVK